MAESNGARWLVDAVADATGRSDDEVRLALTLAVVLAGLYAIVRVLKLLGDLGVDVFDRTRR